MARPIRRTPPVTSATRPASSPWDVDGAELTSPHSA
jgi:hypothetical protein